MKTKLLAALLCGMSLLAQAAFPPDSHDAKGLVDILESLPRDLLVQITARELFEVAIGILGLGERQRVRLFVTQDRLDRYVSCTLCLPRDRFHTENRQRAGRILAERPPGVREEKLIDALADLWTARRIMARAIA